MYKFNKWLILKNNLNNVLIKKQNSNKLLMQNSIKYNSVVELSKSQLIKNQSFNRIFEISSDVASCITTPQLSQKYGILFNSINKSINSSYIIIKELK